MSTSSDFHNGSDLATLLQSMDPNTLEHKVNALVKASRLQKLLEAGTSDTLAEMNITGDLTYTREMLSIPDPGQAIKSSGYTLDPHVPPFTVVQYNILANELATPKHFPYVKPEYLRWIYRRALIARDMLRTNIRRGGSDIIVAQELSNYHDFFQPELEKYGFNSAFYARHSMTCSSWSGFFKRDGCGVFFKRDRFTLADSQGINYADRHDRVAFFVLLRDNEASKRGLKRYVLVVTTHLYWDSTAIEDQKEELRQLELRYQQFLVHALARINAQLAAESTTEGAPAPHVSPLDIAVVLCGDFNSTPGGPIYRFTTKNLLQNVREEVQVELEREFKDTLPSVVARAGFDSLQTLLNATTVRFQSSYASFRKLSPSTKRPDGGPDSPKTVVDTSEEFATFTDATQNANIKGSTDASSEEALGADEPPYTTITLRRNECIDYIFYASPAPLPSGQRPLRLQPIEILDLPPATELGKIPNERTGSDHMPLATTFAYAISE